MMEKKQKELLYQNIQQPRLGFVLISLLDNEIKRIEGTRDLGPCADFKIYGNISLLAASPLVSRGFAPRGNKKIKAKFVKGPGKSSAKKGPRKCSAKKRTKEMFCNVFLGVVGVPPSGK